MCICLKTKWIEFYDKFHLWRSSLKKIEGHCGVGVVELFLFIKLLVFLNSFTTLAVLVLLMVPTVYWVEFARDGWSAADLWNECGSSNESASVECCSAIYENATRLARPRVNMHYVMDMIQGTGWAETTAMYYSYYPDERFAVGRLFTYRIPLAYAATAIGCLAVSFAVILRRSIGGLQQRMVETQVQHYLYSNSAFVGWDFCINNKTSAALKQKAIHDELRSYLAADRSRPDDRNRRGGRRRGVRTAAVRALVSVLVLTFITAACCSVYLAFHYTVRLLQHEQTFARAFVIEFATPVAVAFHSVALPAVFDALARFEKRSARQEARLRVLRTACVKLSLLAALLGSAYRLANCTREKSQCASALCGSPLCWETYVGKIMYRLLVVDVACKIAVTVLISCPRSILIRHCKNRLFQAVCKQELDLAEHVLDVIYVQAIVWLGSFYVTLMPALGLVSLVIMFYIKRFSCVVNYSLARRVYSPSRTHTAIMSMALVTHALCAAAWAVAAARIAPSRSCGPFKGLPSAWTVVTDTVRAVPPWTALVYDILTSGNVVYPVLFTLLCVVYYYRIAVRSNRKMISVLRKQLVLEGHDKQFLLNRLSAFIKQQDKRHKAAAAAVAAATDNNGEIDVLLS